MSNGQPGGFGASWATLTAALGCHVADEALTGFLDLYNPTVRSLRARFAWFPMPTFTFGVWLTGLLALVVVLFALTPFARSNARPLRPLAYLFAAVMFGNGVAHLAGSVYLARWAPGATSAPLLLLASTWLLVTLRRTRS